MVFHSFQNFSVLVLLNMCMGILFSGYLVGRFFPHYIMDVGVAAAQNVIAAFDMTNIIYWLEKHTCS